MNEQAYVMIPLINAANELPFRAHWVKQDDHNYFGERMDTGEPFSCSRTHWELTVFSTDLGDDSAHDDALAYVEQKIQSKSLFGATVAEHDMDRLGQLLQDPTTPIYELQEAAQAAGFKLGITIQPTVSNPNESSDRSC